MQQHVVGLFSKAYFWIFKQSVQVMNSYQPSFAIGAMSGSSLDALDLAYCSFWQHEELWKWELIEKSSIPIPVEWQRVLKEAPQYDLKNFSEIHIKFGSWLGKQIDTFCRTGNLRPNIVVSHGHTLLHNPDKKYTVQLGHGAAVAGECGFPVLCDVRSSDVNQGGQGAPLAHIADVHLLPGYDAYINLGGIANITFLKDINLAYDVCFANQILNRLANQIGLEYDRNGEMARNGHVSEQLRVDLNTDPYYHLPPPKSLDNQYVIDQMGKSVWNSDIGVKDKLATCTFFIAKMLTDEITKYLPQGGHVLISGGGTNNSHLMHELNNLGAKKSIRMVKAPPEILEYKEAIFMAFMGILYLEDLPNCLSSFTGAGKDTINGALYKP